VRHAYILAHHRGVTANRAASTSQLPFFWVGGLTMVVLQALTTGGGGPRTRAVRTPRAPWRCSRARTGNLRFVLGHRPVKPHGLTTPDFAKRGTCPASGGRPRCSQVLPPERRPKPEADLTHTWLGMDRDWRPTHHGGGARYPACRAERRGSFGIPTARGRASTGSVGPRSRGVEVGARSARRDSGTGAQITHDGNLQTGKPRGVQS